MSINVYVINQNGHPLMPCKPAKARKLLRDGKAIVVHRSPFTIKLLWDCEEQVQEVTLGIDKGSHVTGFCCVGKGQILLSGEIQSSPGCQGQNGWSSHQSPQPPQSEVVPGKAVSQSGDEFAQWALAALN